MTAPLARRAPAAAALAEPPARRARAAGPRGAPALPARVSRALAQDLPAGTLRPETLAALEAQVSRVVELLREGRVSDGLVRLGGLLRIAADLSDPVLAVGPEGWPPGVAREYYALFVREPRTRCRWCSTTPRP